MTLSLEERLVCRAVGKSLFQSVLEMGFFALFQGILFPVTVMTIYILLQYVPHHFQYKLRLNRISDRRPCKSTASWVLIGIVLLELVVISATLPLTIARAALPYNFFFHRGLPLLARIESLGTKLTGLEIVMVWLQTIPPVLNDAFIIWRAWAVFQRRKWALYLAITLCLTSLVALTLVYLSAFTSPTSLAAASWLSKTLILSSASTFMSFATNLAATALIAWTLWQHLTFLRRHAGGAQQPFRTWHILALLVESGAVYCLLQVRAHTPCSPAVTNPDLVQLMNFALGIAAGPSSSAATALYVFSNTFCMISIVYPALTVFLIHGPFAIAGVDSTVVSVYASEAMQSV
ncbi:hypothetical protein DXG01_012182 [Tephrocybe rancida]|nr:hypothetical protein DXG01_012182 [Tephrocybe rancida]